MKRTLGKIYALASMAANGKIPPEIAVKEIKALIDAIVRQ